jgi:nicotinamide mononucleotide transporter
VGAPDAWSIAEGVAVLFGFTYVWLAIREDPRCWPAGIVNVSIYFFVFFHARLYATAVLQAVYVALSVYGWRKWRRGGEGEGRLPVASTPPRWAAGLGVAGAAASLGLGLFLRYRTDDALPFPEAATTAFSLVAQWMAARKWLENWLVWIAVDVVYAAMYLSQRLYLSTGLYAVFLVMAVLGYREWRASLARERHARTGGTGERATA